MRLHLYRIRDCYVLYELYQEKTDHAYDLGFQSISNFTQPACSALETSLILEVLDTATKDIHYLSLVVRKPVFGVADPVPHKQGCAVIEDG